MQQVKNQNNSIPLWKKMFNGGNWRQGGMGFRGLREAAQVKNYFPGPGRQNLILNPDNSRQLDPLESNVISSIGQERISQNKILFGASTAGPGTLFSTNVQVTNPRISNSAQLGHFNNKFNKQQFVDFRHTDPVRVTNLRKNPLSIYVENEYKKDDIPAFMTYIRPDDYGTYKNVPAPPASRETILAGINGNPQVNILGLTSNNPFLGLSNVPNATPMFSGKTYGGNLSGSARPIAEALYNTNYVNNITEKPIEVSNVNLNESKCKNKALHHHTQGYNIANQINDGTFIMYPSANKIDNLPWGPRRFSPNPRIAKGGIFANSNLNQSTINGDWVSSSSTIADRRPNMYKNESKLSSISSCDLYKNGSPSASLVCSS